MFNKNYEDYLLSNIYIMNIMILFCHKLKKRNFHPYVLLDKYAKLKQDKTRYLKCPLPSWLTLNQPW